MHVHKPRRHHRHGLRQAAQSVSVENEINNGHHMSVGIISKITLYLFRNFPCNFILLAIFTICESITVAQVRGSFLIKTKDQVITWHVDMYTTCYVIMCTTWHVDTCATCYVNMCTTWKVDMCATWHVEMCATCYFNMCTTWQVDMRATWHVDMCAT